jgi:glycosyltransferase involved in cell wall biosynthesis
MRIIDVNPFFYPYRGGIEHRMHDTCKLLAERGHDVTVVTGRLPGTKETEETDGYRIIRLRSRLINIYNPPFISSKDVLKTLNELNADIVNYNYRWAPSYNKDLMRYDGKKVFTYHNMWGEGMGITGKFSEFQDNRFRKCLNTFDHIICVSDFVKNDLVRRGIPEEKTTAIPSCLNSFPDVSGEEMDFILSLGRLVKTKGLGYLVEAMKHVDSKLIICGKGPERDRIEKLVKKYGLEGRIEIDRKSVV